MAKRKNEEILTVLSKHKKTQLLLIDLPVELLLIIIDKMDCNSVHSLLISSKYLYDTFIENEYMFNLVLQLKYPYEYFNYILIQYYCNAIDVKLHVSFRQMFLNHKAFSKSWNYVIPTHDKNKTRVKLKLESITSAKTRIFLQNCVNAIMDFNMNSYHHIFRCLSKCEKLIKNDSAFSPSVRDSLRTGMVQKMKLYPEQSAFHLIQIIIVLLDLIDKT